MTAVNANQARILLGDLHLTVVATSVEAGIDTNPLDTTTLIDTSRQFITGTEDNSFQMSGWFDTDGSATGLLAKLDAWQQLDVAGAPISYGPSGITIGSELWMLQAIEGGMKIGSKAGAVTDFSIDAKGASGSVLDLGVSLRSGLTAVTTSGQGTGVDNGTSSAGGGAGYLHVTDLSGFTGVTFRVQHSDDDGGSDPYTNLLSFTAATGTTSEQKVVTGSVKRYVRYQRTVTGTGSVTFVVGFARR